MVDINLSMSVMEAQQAEAALADRINLLAAINPEPGSTEAGMVASGLDYTSRAYHRLVIALYPSAQAETASLWAQAVEPELREAYGK